MRRQRPEQKGIALIEFALAGTPLILILMALIQMGLAMWDYGTLAYAVRDAAIYAAMKGQGCSYGANSCSATVGGIASEFKKAAIGLDSGQVNVTLTSSNGSINCNPLNSCTSTTTQWPPSTANAQGSLISVSATYPAIVLFMPMLRVSSIFSGRLSASSQQPILF